MREGPARYFIPILRHPADFPLFAIGGPMGYVEKTKDKIGEVPIRVKPHPRPAEGEGEVTDGSV